MMDQIIESAIEVHISLGPGLLERIYEDALFYEFALRKIKFGRQFFDDLVVGSQ